MLMKRDEFSKLEESLKELRDQQKELLEKVEAVTTEEELEEIQNESEKLDKEVEELEEERTKTEEEIQNLTHQLEELNRSSEKKKEVQKMEKVRNEEMELEVRGLIDFLNSKGEKREGIKVSDIGAIVPKTIMYTAQEEIKTTYDLSNAVNVVPVYTAGGTYAYSKKVSASFASVDELTANPDLAKPVLSNIQWNIKTYRGSLPFSNESIQDAPQLKNLIASTISQYALNTKNKVIADVLKTATAKKVNSVDALKALVNVDLDPAYNKVIIATQSGFNYLDTLKDGNGRYLMQDDVTSPTGKTILGMPIWVIADNLLGAQGDSKAFIGDAKRFVSLFDRLELQLGWVTNETYGQQMMGAMRMDCKAVDTKAGFFVTLEK